MVLIQVQFAPWDKKYSFAANGKEYEVNNQVIVDTEFGLELGIVTGFEATDTAPADLKNVIRLASKNDLAALPHDSEKQAAMEYCREAIVKNKLDMKLVDVVFSFTGSRLNFAFSAEGRVDFRQLVKDLTTKFNKSVRLTQIGARDEARLCGDCGHCGQELCCKTYIKDFFSVTSEMAEAQQVAHRGSERISGMCGRLLCCLTHEYEGYKELHKGMPPVGTKVNVDGKRGEIISQHILKQSVNVKFQGERPGEYVISEVDLNRHKKKKEV